MKKRTLLTNIFVIVLMISIVFVLLAFFNIFPEKIQNPVLLASMTMALVSVLLVDIVFPLLDNIDRFKSETSYKVKTAVKGVLFVVAVVFLIITVNGVIEQIVGIALFCVTYLAQFFIDLDKNKNVQIEEDDEDDDEETDSDEDSNVLAFDDEDEFDNSYDNEDEDIK